MNDQPRLSIIPGWCSMDPRLKGKDLQVLCVLGRNASTKSGWTRRSQVIMAEQLGCARSTVQASLDRLIEIGAVERRVVVAKSGRDSAHWYRVIYDREPPDGYAFDAWDGDENEENILDDPDFEDTPPAGIPAPPAGPESAPPAGPGSAPINASHLTPPVERTEKNAGEPEDDRRAIERGFMRLVKVWPNIEGLPKDGWFAAWEALTSDERRDAERLFPEWIKVLEKGGKAGRHTPRPSTYFRSKLWREIPEPPAAPPQPEAVAAFGKGGMALRFWILNQPEKPHPAPSAFVAAILAEGGERADAEMINRRAAYSWPRLVDLDRRALEREPIRVMPDIAALGADFVSAELAGLVGDAWKRLFKRMRMPWLPTIPGPSDWPKYAYLPPIGSDADDLDKAVAAAWWQFSERCKGHADAA